jgi:hypothetical protein
MQTEDVILLWIALFGVIALVGVISLLEIIP